MHEYGADLRDWIHPVRGRALLDLIDQCPDSCRWREAASLDVDLMRESMSDDGAQPKKSDWRPRLSEFNLTNYLLLELVNMTAVQVQGKQLKKVQPLHGPRTAQDLIRMERSAAGAFDLIAQVTPHALKGGPPDG